jgi:magnesium transporter
MFKTRRALPGSSPGLFEPRRHETTGAPPTVKVAEYREGDLVEREVATIEELPACDQSDRTYWIEVNGIGDPSVLHALGQKYGLHPLALEDVIHTPQRPKIEAYESHLFLIVQMLYRLPDKRMCGEQVSMFLGKNLLITIQEESEFDVFSPVRDRIRSGRGLIRKQGPDYLAYALLDAVIDHCFPLLESVGDALEELEDAVLDRPRPAVVGMIHEYRRTLLQLRRFVWPERDVVSALLHDETGLIRKETKVFLRDCYDHTIQLMDLVESYRDVASGLMELYLSAVGLRTNEIMRVLTVMSSIFIPLTFLVGVYGMNFDNADGRMPLNMPELHHPLGYVVCVLVMIAIAIGQILFFKRKDWL